MTTTKKIHSRTIVRDNKAARYSDKDTPKHVAMIKKAEARGNLISTADKVANHTMYHINYKWTNVVHISSDIDFNMVAKYYPYANGGPLYVDEPRDERELQRCLEKQKFFKAQGLRYVILEQDSKVIDALEQLGEI